MEKSSTLKNLGKNLRALRIAKGISQEDCAGKADLDRAYYGRVERGEVNISILSLEKITQVLGVGIQDIFGNKNIS